MKIVYHHRTQCKLAEGVHVREVVKALRALGHEVDVVSPPGVDPFAEQSVRTSAPSLSSRLWHGISRYMPQAGFEIMELGYNYIASVNVKKIINKKGIDLIYERHAFFAWACATLAKRYNIPIIIEVNEISGLKRTRGQCFVGIARRIEQETFEKADAIIVVSGFLKKKIAEHGVAPEKIHVMANAVDASVFNPAQVPPVKPEYTALLAGRVVLGFVGSFVKWHNFEFLLNNVKEIIDELPHTNVSLMLVGDGPLKEELRKIVEQKRLANHVIFTGNVSHESIPAYINMMDICIIPQANEFRSPIKLYEYMAMGKPVIAPDVEPVRKAIAHGENGILFTAEDSLSFKQGITAVLNDKNKREELGHKARQSVLTKYSWRNNAEKILDIYATIKREI